MKLLKIILVLILFIALLMIAYLNQNEVTVGYYYGKTVEGVPLFIVIFAAILIGLIIAGLISASDLLRKNLTIRRLNQNIKTLEEEIQSLRRLQLAEGVETEPETPVDRDF